MIKASLYCFICFEKQLKKQKALSFMILLLKLIYVLKFLYLYQIKVLTKGNVKLELHTKKMKRKQHIFSNRKKIEI